jgi:DNA primase
MAKRNIPKAVFEPWDGLVAADLLEAPPLVELVKKEAPKAIRDALNNRKTLATLFQVNHSEHYIDIPTPYWIAALEECIKYLIEEQRYEECKEIKKLIDDIKLGSKTLPNKQLKPKDDGKAANGDTISN